MADPESLYRYVKINSKDRVQGTSSNFSIDLSQDQTTHKVHEVHIMSASILHNFYNITTNNSSLVVIGSIGGLNVFSVSEGFYTTTELLAELKTQIDAFYAPTTITFTQDPLTNKISYTAVGENISFVSVGDNALSTMAPNLGITTTTPSALTGTFSDTPSLNGVEHVYIQSSKLNGNPTVTSRGGVFDDTFLAMPVRVPYGFLITYQAQAAHQEQITYNTIRDLSTLDIRITDDDGNELDVGDNHEFVLVLKFFYIP